MLGRSCASGTPRQRALTAPSLRALPASQRRDCKDYVTVFATRGWKVAAHFSVGTVDLEEIAYSPDGTCIAVCDNLLEYAVLVYSPDGSLKTRRAHPPSRARARTG